MRVLVSGTGGMIGAAVYEKLCKEGYTVSKLVRSSEQAADKDVVWNTQTYDIAEPSRLEDFDAVIHLGGESIMGRWHPTKKQTIYRSRVSSTGALSRALAKLNNKPKTLIVASAVGYYGDRGDKVLTEKSEAGYGFLCHVCGDWEGATISASEVGIRTVSTRIGMVLSPNGGALKTMLTPFRMRLGGVVGPGTQYMSWIALPDLLNAFVHILNTPAIIGPVNLVAPNPVTNEEFTKALGKTLNRPTFLPLPGFVARLLLGEMADALLLSSQRVIPERLEQSGFAFEYSELPQALEALINH